MPRLFLCQVVGACPHLAFLLCHIFPPAGAVVRMVVCAILEMAGVPRCAGPILSPSCAKELHGLWPRSWLGQPHMSGKTALQLCTICCTYSTTNSEHWKPYPQLAMLLRPAVAAGTANDGNVDVELPSELAVVGVAHPLGKSVARSEPSFEGVWHVDARLVLATWSAASS